ncbi:MAG: hypothetical protein IPP42_04800 [Saprospiraceae bacterium]|nr:hypothetical protein [Saprospiraceae bacterium]
MSLKAKSSILSESLRRSVRGDDKPASRFRKRQSLVEAARIEVGLRHLNDGGFQAFTDTFEDLHGSPAPGHRSPTIDGEGCGFAGRRLEDRCIGT